MRIRHAAVVAGLALGLMVGTAKAELLHFDYKGSHAFSFNLDSEPKPTESIDKKWTVFAFDSFVNGTQVEDHSDSWIHFVSGASDGGFETFGPNFHVWHTGGQIYSGTEADPIFSPGVYHYDDGDHGTLTISVSTVPLPASAPMFGAALLALAGFGYAAGRKRAAIAA